MRIEDSVLRNHTNVRTTTPYGVTGGGVWLPPRRVELHRVLFGDLPNYTGSEPQSNIRPEFIPQYGANVNTIVSSRIVVTDYNRVTGDNFEVFEKEQAPDFVVPQTESVPGLVGSPVAGLTNQQTWSRFGLAISGAVAPCSNTKPGVMGFACATRAPAPASMTDAAASTGSASLVSQAATALAAIFGVIASVLLTSARPANRQTRLPLRG
jgi:hypothetical protein